MENYAKELSRRAKPLRDSTSLEPLLEKIKDKKVVMLGEASHGTHEFYEWRRLITRELIQNHGFSFVAVEGDWPSAETINEAIKAGNQLPPQDVLSAFSRWPTWMWANTDVSNLIEDLRELNSNFRRKVGFHGLDVYSLFESIDQVIKSLKAVDPELAERAREYYSCMEPYRHNEIEYVRSLFGGPEGCREEVTTVLQEALNHRLEGMWEKDEALFDAVQNARVVQNAERYYRSMAGGNEDSWNIRDTHMMETLKMLLDHYGQGAKAIVWEHNTHIGDYRATSMLAQGNVNIGGLARQQLGEENVALVGFSTYQGSVIASHAWDGPIEILEVPPAREDSLEQELHGIIPEVGSDNFLVLLDQEAREGVLNEYKGHRAIGVVYHPQFERRGNYVPTKLASRYDALLFFDHSRALTPYRIGHDPHKIPETYPFGARL